MRKKSLNRWAVTALLGLTAMSALPMVAHAGDKMMSHDKTDNGAMMSKDAMSKGKMSKDKMMDGNMKCTRKDCAACKAMSNKNLSKTERQRMAWYKKEYGKTWHAHYTPGK